jgi:mercuric ion transport protein
MKNRLIKSSSMLRWFTLFTSTGTLICCAIPIILVSFGFGASVAALTQIFPLLIFLSIHKIWIFTFSGVLLIISGWLIYRPNRLCPSDPELGLLCYQAQRWNVRFFWLSTLIWGIGFFAAFLALPLRIIFTG